MPASLSRNFLVASLILVLLVLLGCNTATGPQRPLPSSNRPVSEVPVDTLLELARTSEGTESSTYLISALEILVHDGEIDDVNRLLEDLDDVELLNADLQWRHALIQASLAMQQDDAPLALEWLNGERVDAALPEGFSAQLFLWDLRAEANLRAEQPEPALRDLIRLSTAQTSPERSALSDRIWAILANFSDQQLAALAVSADSYEYRGWVELARQIRGNRNSIRNQLDAVDRWRTSWARHSAIANPPESLVNLQAVWDQRPRHIALLLPLQDQVGKAVQEGFLSAYYEALSRGSEVPRISLFDTTPLSNPGAPQDIYGLYDTAVAQGADLVIGPLDKALVTQLHSMSRLPVPTLALNYTDNEQRLSPDFFQFGLAPEDEIRQAAQLAHAAGYRNAAVVAPSGSDYRRLQDAFSSYWESLGGEVVARVSFDTENEYADLIKQLLAIDRSEDRAARITQLLPRNDVEFIPRRRQDIDFIYLMANPRQGRQIKPTLAFYFAGDIPVYALSAIYDGQENQLANQDLNGIIFTDTPWLLAEQDPLKRQVNDSLRVAQGPLQRLRALGVDSFRLYPRLQQMADGEITSFEGVTGVLTMTGFGAIQRQPVPAIFLDGRPRPLPAE